MRLTIDSRLENIPLVGMAINAICVAACRSEIEAYQIELCLVEAASNAVRHAYRGRAGHPVEIELEFDSDRLMIRVSDYGEAMTELSVPSLDLDPDDHANLPEGGLGLYLIDRVMSECRYTSVGGRNTLEMVKLLPAGARDAGDRARS